METMCYTIFHFTCLSLLFLTNFEVNSILYQMHIAKNKTWYQHFPVESTDIERDGQNSFVALMMIMTIYKKLSNDIFCWYEIGDYDDDNKLCCLFVLAYNRVSVQTFTFIFWKVECVSIDWLFIERNLLILKYRNLVTHVEMCFSQFNWANYVKCEDIPLYDKKNQLSFQLFM